MRICISSNSGTVIFSGSDTLLQSSTAFFIVENILLVVLESLLTSLTSRNSPFLSKIQLLLNISRVSCNSKSSQYSNI